MKLPRLLRRYREPTTPRSRQPTPREHPLYAEMFDTVRRDWDAHDETCESLPWFWAAHRGGVSSLGDIESCHACGVTFYFEGLAWVNYEAEGEEDELRLCGCCARSQGHAVKATSFGLSTAE